MPVTVLLDLRYSGHLIEEAPTTYERVCGRVCTKELRPSQLIYSGEFGPRRRILIYQNIANTVFAAVGIVLAAPVMLLTALAVRFSSSAPSCTGRLGSEWTAFPSPSISSGPCEQTLKSAPERSGRRRTTLASRRLAVSYGEFASTSCRSSSMC
jgi:hypothetical protein